MDIKPILVGCYVRVSTENQIENYSIEEQSERLKAYCKAKDFTIYKIYTDGGFSGGNLERPSLNQMLNDIHSKTFDTVIVYKLDRLSRSQKDTLTLIEDEFLANDIDFISISENFDTSTPFGKAMIGILSVFAQLEKDQITERFTMGRIGRSKAGYYHGGATAPTGYDYIDSKLVVNEYKALQVKEVYERFLNGYSINSIQKYMHQKYGGWTSASLVSNVLSNSIYIGKVKFKKQEFNGIHDPIVDEDIFHQVQSLLNSVERETKKTTAQKTPFKASNVLSSLVYCARCNARYSGNHGYYRCYSRSKSAAKYITNPNCKNDNWEISKLDNLVMNQILQLNHNKGYLENIFNSDNKNEHNVHHSKYTARLKEIDTQLERMIDLYQLRSISMQQINQRVDALQKEKDNLNIQLSKKSPNILERKNSFINMLDSLEKIFHDACIEEKRMFISNFIESVFIDGNSVKMKWRI